MNPDNIIFPLNIFTSYLYRTSYISLLQDLLFPTQRAAHDMSGSRAKQKQHNIIWMPRQGPLCISNTARGRNFAQTYRKGSILVFCRERLPTPRCIAKRLQTYSEKRIACANKRLRKRHIFPTDEKNRFHGEKNGLYDKYNGLSRQTNCKEFNESKL